MGSYRPQIPPVKAKYEEAVFLNVRVEGSPLWDVSVCAYG
jgi:hypothetical protein